MSKSRRRPASRSAMILCAAVLPSVVLSSAAWATGPLDAYLPKGGTIKGHIVQLEVAKDDQAISKQFRLAVQTNMDWFKHYVTSNKPGQPLPYNPKMGVTQEQYDKLLHMKAEMKEQAPIEITVRRGEDGSIAFDTSDPAAAALKDTRFAPDEKVAVTPFGPLAIFNEIHQSDVNAPFGVWNGAEWARIAEDGSDQPSVKVAFGKRQAGDGVFYYQVAPTKEKEEQSLVVVYKLD